MYSPAPILADFKTTPYKNRFQISFSPTEMVNNGIIFKGAAGFLDMMGLIESEVTEGEGVHSNTKLYVGVKTHCAEADLVAKFGADIAKAAMFIITDKATGNVITPSAVAVVSGEIEFTGTFPDATYNVVGSAPAVWSAQTPAIEGYDASENGVDIVVS